MGKRGLERFKVETAAELGIPNYDQVDKGDLPSRVNGYVGGMMVRKMVNIAEAVLSGHTIDTSYGSSVTQDDVQSVQNSLQHAGQNHSADGITQ